MARVDKLKPQVKIKNTKKEKEEKAHKKAKVAAAKDLDKASRKLAEYLSHNGLDPKKDYTKDPEHGPMVAKLQKAVRIAKGKVDPTIKAKQVKNNIDKKTVKDRRRPVVNTYDYPKIDGREMTREERKKFRSKMRRMLNGNVSKEEAYKRSLEFMQGIEQEDPVKANIAQSKQLSKSLKEKGKLIKKKVKKEAPAEEPKKKVKSKDKDKKKVKVKKTIEED